MKGDYLGYQSSRGDSQSTSYASQLERGLGKQNGFVQVIVNYMNFQSIQDINNHLEMISNQLVTQSFSYNNYDLASNNWSLF